jgi:2,3-bisphosphoglycerate-independent phosphoglycerate mutase
VQYNHQNDKIYVQKSHKVKENIPRVQTGHHPAYVSLVGGVPSGDDTSSFLQERGETGVQVYQEDMLQGVVKQLNMTLFSGQE